MAQNLKTVVVMKAANREDTWCEAVGNDQVRIFHNRQRHVSVSDGIYLEHGVVEAM